MTPETTAMRLADLNPRDVGRDAARRLVDHLSAAAVRLSPAVTVEVYAPRWRENALPAHGAVTDEVLDGTSRWWGAVKQPKKSGAKTTRAKKGGAK